MLLGFITGAVMIVSGALALRFGAEDISGSFFLALGGIELAVGFVSTGFFVHFLKKPGLRAGLGRDGILGVVPGIKPPA